MRFLLDTTAFSDLMREHPKMDARLAGISEEHRVVICPIVRGEIQYGIERLPQGKRRRELAAKSDKLFARIPSESVTEEAAQYYARTKVARERRGLALDENDLWIAATALALEAVLVSRDGDFGGVDGLEVEDWTE